MKKILFTFVFVCLILYSCFYPEVTIEASKNGISIWFNQILPALLPFTILSAILIKSNFIHSLKGNGNITACLLTMLCGFVFGFPIGAKLASDFYKNKLLTENQATVLAISCNNFSPMYVCGFVLPTLFDNTYYNSITYLLIYFLPLLLVTLFLLVYKKESISAYPEKKAIFHLDMKLMDAGIIGGFESLIKICGYIVLFSIVADTLSRLWNNPPFLWNLLLENLEITNGIHLLSQSTISESSKYITAIQLLSFGGLSGFAQTASLFADSGLSAYKYIIGKVILSLFLTLLCIIYV